MTRQKGQKETPDRAVELLCDKYDANPEEYGPDFIRSLMSEQEVDSSNRGRLLQELVMMDIDRNLVRMCDAQRQPERPVLMGYRDVFQELGNDLDTLARLAAYEFSCWVDLEFYPQVGNFLVDLPPSHRLQEYLHAELIKTACPIIQVVAKGRLLFETPLGFDTCFLGRQRQNEDGPFADYYEKAGRRIILAASDDNSISRDQLSLRWLVGCMVEVSNRSKTTRILANDQYLPSGSNIQQTLPCDLQFRDMELWIHDDD